MSIIFIHSNSRMEYIVIVDWSFGFLDILLRSLNLNQNLKYAQFQSSV